MPQRSSSVALGHGSSADNVRSAAFPEGLHCRSEVLHLWLGDRHIFPICKGEALIGTDPELSREVLALKASVPSLDFYRMALGNFCEPCALPSSTLHCS